MKQPQQIQEDWNNLLYLIRPPKTKAAIQKQQKQQKAYILMKIEQLSTQWLLGQDRKKEIKDFLEFMNMKGTAYPTYGTLWK